MTAKQLSWFVGLLAQMLAEKTKESVTDWCQRHVVFNEPGCSGPFSLSGREYLREPLDNGSDPSITDMILVFATRSGKTRVLFCFMAWIIAHIPSRILYVKPTTKGTAGAENDARTRWIPLLRASPELARHIPDGGNRRHEFKTAQQIINGSIADWTGSNSVANLASNSCHVVVQDEVDKFNTTRKRDTEGNVVEADASSLADERCKEFSTPKRFKASTPTLISGRIWEELKKSDLRRYFVPCPHCAKHVVFAWSKQFTVLPKLGCEAFIAWDSKAKDKSGEWNLEQVEATAHMVCPHCQGKILDAHKTRMVRAGEWRPTQTSAKGYRGYHLPAMYCAHRECNFGRMAVRFLQAKNSVQGLQGFINSDLAEPYLGQEVSSERTELISKVEVTKEWTTLLTVDCQQRAPYFWFVARAWSAKETHGLEASSCDQWDEIQAVQKKHSIPNVGVMVDSGFGAKDDAEVYRVCAENGDMIVPVQDQLPLVCGWMPAKGFPSRKRWRSPKGVYLPWRYQPTDPYAGTDQAGQLRIELFEFAAEFFKDILSSLRKGGGSMKWSVSDAVAREIYWKHMDGQVKTEHFNKISGQTTWKWDKRHRYWPDHLFSCEVMQVAFASALEIFSYQ